MKKVVFVRIILVILILFLFVAALAIVKKRSSISNEAQELELLSLKESQYTNEKFEEIEIGDSVETVDMIMGDIQMVDIESEYDVYESLDVDILYYFYFKHDKLKNVTVYTN